MSDKPRYDTKYAKIQPAVAIKPKPAKGQSPSKVSFDPKYDPLKSVPSILCDDQSTIHTSRPGVLPSRQWVLPPRPRPGRKPTLKEAGAVRGGRAERTGGKPEKSGKPEKAADGPGPPGDAAPVHQEVTALQKMLLARLQEQELVQNYIEVLTNQIHELKLAQSGVITFDALSSEPAPRRHVPASPDHLDHIHNVRDLDKFLAHMTTQAKVIHSVTKKNVTSRHVRGEGDLPSQIQRLRMQQRQGSHGRGDAESGRADTESGRRDSESGRADTESGRADSESGRPAPHPSRSSHAKTFTPSLLRPMNLNAFEENDVIDIISDRDARGREDKDDLLRVELGKEADFGKEFAREFGKEFGKEFGSWKDSGLGWKDSRDKESEFKARKRGCGFCSGDAPCLCFDADNLFGERL